MGDFVKGLGAKFAAALSDFTANGKDVTASVWAASRNLYAVKIFLTLSLLAWAATLSGLYSKSRTQDGKDKLKFIKGIWLGDPTSGVLVLLWRMWLISILFLAALPLIMKLLKVGTVVIR